MVDPDVKDWERLRKDIPALENSIDDAMAECHNDLADKERIEYEAKWKDESLEDITARQDEEDVVNHPSHYASGGIECIDAIQESMSEIAFKGYLKGNVQKYLWRYEMKGKPVEDLKKAQWYLNRLIESVEFEDGY